MGTDLLRIQSNERVDRGDFNFAVDTAMQSAHRQVQTQLITDPAKNTQWIIDGFTISNPSGEQVQVTLGRAILGQREGGEVFQGQLASAGEDSRIIDVATFANATYNIYIRFEYVDGTSQGRAFWNPQGSGSEIAQTMATRRLANWSMRIETASPGAEWFKIGEVVVSSSAISTGAGGLVDQRNFFFEGQRDADIAPATPADNGTQFISGWSTDGGGVANDRSDDRELYGVKDLQTFTGAMRQCLEDIKGRGLRRWWDRDIGGMNIGFDADPSEGVLAVGDTNFGLDFDSGTSPRLDFASSTYIGFTRSTSRYRFFISGSPEFEVTADGAIVTNGLTVGNAALTPVDDTITLGNSSFFFFWDGTDGLLNFDTNDILWYDRSANTYVFDIGGAAEFQVSASGATITNGLTVGAATTPEDDTIIVGDPDFKIHWDGTDSYILFDGFTGYISYDRSASQYIFAAGSGSAATLSNSGLNITAGGIAVGHTGTPAADTASVGDSAFNLNFDGTDPYINFATDDYLYFDRSVNGLKLWVDSTQVFHFADDFVNIGMNIPIEWSESGDFWFIGQSMDVLDYGTFVAGVRATAASTKDYALNVSNGYDHIDSKGIRIQCGEDDQAASTAYYIECYDNDANGGNLVGALRNASGTFAVYDPSDLRIKRDVAESTVDGVKVLMAVDLIEYRLKRDGDSAPLNPIGFSAQNLLRAWPRAVSGNESEQYMVSQTSMIPLLVKAVQQLTTRIEELENPI